MFVVQYIICFKESVQCDCVCCYYYCCSFFYHFIESWSWWYFLLGNKTSYNICMSWCSKCRYVLVVVCQAFTPSDKAGALQVDSSLCSIFEHRHSQSHHKKTLYLFMVWGQMLSNLHPRYIYWVLLSPILL